MDKSRRDSIEFSVIAGLGVVISPQSLLMPIEKLTTDIVATPIQFLQNQLPGYMEAITAARGIDTLIGSTIKGRWETEGIIKPISTSWDSPTEAEIKEDLEKVFPPSFFR